MTTTTSRWCIATFVALAAIAACDAAVHPYAGEYFEPHADAYVFRAGREGLFAQVDDDHETEAWSTAAPGVSNGESYVRFDRVRFNRPASVASRFDAGGAETGLVEAVLFELNDHDRVGFVDPAGYTRFCCAEDLVESTGCVPGRLIVTPRDDDPESPWVKAVPFSGDDVDARVYDQTVRIRKTGMYYLWFVSCDPNSAPRSPSAAPRLEKSLGLPPRHGSLHASLLRRPLPRLPRRSARRGSSPPPRSGARSCRCSTASRSSSRSAWRNPRRGTSTTSTSTPRGTAPTPPPSSRFSSGPRARRL